MNVWKIQNETKLWLHERQWVFFSLHAWTLTKQRQKIWILFLLLIFLLLVWWIWCDLWHTSCVCAYFWLCLSLSMFFIFIVFYHEKTNCFSWCCCCYLWPDILRWLWVVHLCNISCNNGINSKMWVVGSYCMIYFIHVYQYG